LVVRRQQFGHNGLTSLFGITRHIDLQSLPELLIECISEGDIYPDRGGASWGVIAFLIENDISVQNEHRIQITPFNQPFTRRKHSSSFSRSTLFVSMSREKTNELSAF
jgi:hypothetical protein